MFSKYIFIRQETQSDCGAACLVMIARQLGISASITSTRVYTGTDQTGTTVLGLIDGAKEFGLIGRAVRASSDALKAIKVPAIAHVAKDDVLHFVVIYKINKDNILIADPAEGLLEMPTSRFLKIWTGIIVMFEKSGRSVKRHSRFSALLRFYSIIKPYDVYIAEILLASILLTLMGFAVPLYLQVAVDSLLQNKDIESLTKVMGALVVILVCRSLLGTLRGVFMAYVSRKADAAIISSFYRHAIRLPMVFFQGTRVGDVISRFGDAIKIRELLGVTTVAAIVDALSLICGFGLLLYYSVSLTLIMVAGVIAAVAISIMLQKRLRAIQRAILDNIGRLQSNMVESITCISTLKTLNAEFLAVSRCEGSLVRLLTAYFRASMFGISMATVSDLLITIGMVAALWQLGLMVIHGHLTIGEMIAYYTILNAVLQPIFRLVMSNQTIQDSLAATDRLGELMDLPEEPTGTYKALAQYTSACDLQICDVTFRYAARHPVLQNIKLSIPRGNMLALVGESGSGKSTLAKLLIRAFDPQKGEIKIDGQNIQDFDISALRSTVGYLEQEYFFFSGTIEDNLRYGKPDATEDEMKQVLQRVGLPEFGMRLKLLIGERGVNLSGGQKQRLAISRLLLRTPRLIILDEPTSNLDAHSEINFLRLLQTLREQSTIIFIAHRLSSVRIADSIAVLHQGRIVESGTHEELLAKGEAYASLWQAQTRMNIIVEN